MAWVKTHVAYRRKCLSGADKGSHSRAAAAVRLAEVCDERLVEICEEISRDLLELIVQVLIRRIHLEGLGLNAMSKELQGKGAWELVSPFEVKLASLLEQRGE